MISDIINYICIHDVCLTQKELLSALIGGAITGIVAILVYVIQKRMERKNSKYNTADTLYNEVSRILKSKSNKNNFAINTLVPPNSRIYEGLLASGNIKYFVSELQDDLNVFYTRLELFPKDLDIKLGEKILQTLEIIKEKNTSLRYSYYKKFKLQYMVNYIKN